MIYVVYLGILKSSWLNFCFAGDEWFDWVIIVRHDDEWLKELSDDKA